MGQAVVLKVQKDPYLQGRLLITVRATSQCMASVRSGNRQLILREGEGLTASIAETAFGDVAPGQTINGSNFCRFAIGHIRQTP